MPIIRQQLGHTSLVTTDRYVSHLAPVDLIHTCSNATGPYRAGELTQPPSQPPIRADMGGSIRGRGGEMVLIGLAARPGEDHMFDRVESRAMLPAGDRPTGEA